MDRPGTRQRVAEPLDGKRGWVVRQEVEISTRKLRFYRNGKPNPLVKITIPEALAAVKLYPYVQLIGDGDSITFL